MEVKADVTLEIDLDRKVFTLTFSGQLKLIKLGTVGATAGRFVLDMSNTLSHIPQFWGVATLETNLSALEQYGIFLFGKGTLQINTTQFTKTETLTLPGLGPNGTDDADVRAAAAELLDRARRAARIRAAGHDAPTSSGSRAGSSSRIDPTTIQIYETAELSFGVGDAQLSYGHSTGLIIVKTGLDGSFPGVAGMLSDRRVGRTSASRASASLFRSPGPSRVMFNTTLQDQTFKIPDAFLPLLHPGDPTSITIYGSAPGLDGQRRAERAAGRRDLRRRDDRGQHHDRRRPHAQRLHPDRGRGRPDGGRA